VVFDAGGVLEVVDDLSWLDRWRVRAGLDPAEGEAALGRVDPTGLAAVGSVSEAELRSRYAGELGLDDSAADAFMADLWDWYCGRLDVELIVDSHEVGVAKPDPAVFALTAERVGAAPGQLVLLDDVAANVEAARAAGWQAVLHRDTAASIAAVDALLGR
jgi:putative hydrolase of the HAD superfamily